MAYVALISVNLLLALCAPYLAALQAQYWGWGVVVGAAVAVSINFLLVRRNPDLVGAARFSSLAALASSIGIILYSLNDLIASSVDSVQTAVVSVCVLMLFLSPLFFAEVFEPISKGFLNRLRGRLHSRSSGIAILAALGWVFAPAALIYYAPTSTILIQKIYKYAGFGPSETAFVQIALQDEYLFCDSVSIVTKNLEPEAILKASRIQLDEWSYAREASAGINYSEGEVEDFGLRFERQPDNRIVVKDVLSNSPAEKADIRRGDRVVRLNGQFSRSMSDQEFEKSLDASQTVLLIQTYRAGSGVYRYKLHKTLYKINPIADVKILKYQNANVAYLRVTRFTEDFERYANDLLAELDKKEFDTMILDLRYNGGGNVSSMLYLAGALAGSGVQDRVGMSSYKNHRYAHLRRIDVLTAEPKVSLNIKNIAVIVTGDTCSASEELIMILRPYISVGVIGSPTCGKPYLVRQTNYKNTKLSLVTSVVQNVLGDSVPISGIDPDCDADDDLAHMLGDVDEASTKAALHWLVKNKQCLPARVDFR
jgi:carboxyl-terminal processing protease